jgi:hypothetical protein
MAPEVVPAMGGDPADPPGGPAGTGDSGLPAGTGNSAEPPAGPVWRRWLAAGVPRLRRGRPNGARDRMSWRVWRRSRPFWGGLLLVLAGLELMVIPLSGVLGHGAVKLVIYIGIGGVFGVLIGVLLIASGVLLCLNPVHRQFYGIAGVVLGILSFPASNLGGFFIGMLLAIVGGSIAFAWAPVEQARVKRAESALAGGPGAEHAGDAAEAEPPTQPLSVARPQSHRAPAVGLAGFRRFDALRAKHQRRMALTAMPLVMGAALLGSPGASAAPAAPQEICILWIFCFPSPSPSPTPTPSPSASPSPGSLLPGSPKPSASPSPGASPGAPKSTPGTPGLVAATATSTITAGSATLDDFAFQGVASLPTAAAGAVQVMKFTASSLTLSGDVTATVTQGGASTVTTSPSLAFSGSVVLYATSLSGCIGPLCVTLTPSSVLTGLLKLVGPITSHLSLTLTSVTTDQPVVTAGSLQTGALSISVS